MARKVVKHCDVCKKPTDEIVGKLLYIPLTPNGGRQRAHSNYSHHADVGVCCGKRLLELFNFQKRTTFDEYQAKRRAG
jgi:hypothetical protein